MNSDLITLVLYVDGVERDRFTTQFRSSADDWHRYTLQSYYARGYRDVIVRPSR